MDVLSAIALVGLEFVHNVVSVGVGFSEYAYPADAILHILFAENDAPDVVGVISVMLFTALPLSVI